MAWLACESAPFVILIVFPPSEHQFIPSKESNPVQKWRCGHAVTDGLTDVIYSFVRLLFLTLNAALNDFHNVWNDAVVNTFLSN